MIGSGASLFSALSGQNVLVKHTIGQKDSEPCCSPLFTAPPAATLASLHVTEPPATGRPSLTEVWAHDRTTDCCYVVHQATKMAQEALAVRGGAPWAVRACIVFVVQ